MASGPTPTVAGAGTALSLRDVAAMLSPDSAIRTPVERQFLAFLAAQPSICAASLVALLAELSRVTAATDAEIDAAAKFIQTAVIRCLAGATRPPKEAKATAGRKAAGGSTSHAERVDEAIAVAIRDLGALEHTVQHLLFGADIEPSTAVTAAAATIAAELLRLELVRADGPLAAAMQTASVALSATNVVADRSAVLPLLRATVHLCTRSIAALATAVDTEGDSDRKPRHDVLSARRRVQCGFLDFEAHVVAQWCVQCVSHVAAVVLDLNQQQHVTTATAVIAQRFLSVVADPNWCAIAADAVQCTSRLVQFLAARLSSGDGTISEAQLLGALPPLCRAGMAWTDGFGAVASDWVAHGTMRPSAEPSIARTAALRPGADVDRLWSIGRHLTVSMGAIALLDGVVVDDLGDGATAWCAQLCAAPLAATVVAILDATLAAAVAASVGGAFIVPQLSEAEEAFVIAYLQAVSEIAQLPLRETVGGNARNSSSLLLHADSDGLRAVLAVVDAVLRFTEWTSAATIGVTTDHVSVRDQEKDVKLAFSSVHGGRRGNRSSRDDGDSDDDADLGGDDPDEDPDVSSDGDDDDDGAVEASPLHQAALWALQCLATSSAPSQRGVVAHVVASVAGSADAVVGAPLDAFAATRCLASLAAFSEIADEAYGLLTSGAILDAPGPAAQITAVCDRVVVLGQHATIADGHAPPRLLWAIRRAAVAAIGRIALGAVDSLTAAASVSVADDETESDDDCDGDAADTGEAKASPCRQTTGMVPPPNPQAAGDLAIVHTACTWLCSSLLSTESKRCQERALSALRDVFHRARSLVDNDAAALAARLADVALLQAVYALPSACGLGGELEHAPTQAAPRALQLKGRTQLYHLLTAAVQIDTLTDRRAAVMRGAATNGSHRHPPVGEAPSSIVLASAHATVFAPLLKEWQRSAPTSYDAAILCQLFADIFEAAASADDTEGGNDTDGTKNGDVRCTSLATARADLCTSLVHSYAPFIAERCSAMLQQFAAADSTAHVHSAAIAALVVDLLSTLCTAAGPENATYLLSETVIEAAGGMTRFDDSEAQRAGFSLLGELAAVAKAARCSTRSSSGGDAEGQRVVAAAAAYLLPVAAAVVRNLTAFDEDNIFSHSNALWCAAEWVDAYGARAFGDGLTAAEVQSGLVSNDAGGVQDGAAATGRFLLMLIVLMANRELHCYTSFRVNALIAALRLVSADLEGDPGHLASLPSPHADDGDDGDDDPQPIHDNALVTLFRLAPGIAVKAVDESEKNELFCRIAQLVERAAAGDAAVTPLRQVLLGRPAAVLEAAAMATKGVRKDIGVGTAAAKGNQQSGSESVRSGMATKQDVLRCWAPLVAMAAASLGGLRGVKAAVSDAATVKFLVKHYAI